MEYVIVIYEVIVRIPTFFSHASPFEAIVFEVDHDTNVDIFFSKDLMSGLPCCEGFIPYNTKLILIIILLLNYRRGELKLSI